MNNKEITNNDIMDILLEMKKTSTTDREETKLELDKIDKKIESIKTKVDAKEAFDNKRMNRMNARMTKIEAIIDKNNDALDEIEILRKDQT